MRYRSDGVFGWRVQAGDTLTLIAELYNTSVAALEQLNADKLSQGPDLLEIGSTLDVPLQGLLLARDERQQKRDSPAPPPADSPSSGGEPLSNHVPGIGKKSTSVHSLSANKASLTEKRQGENSGDGGSGAGVGAGDAGLVSRQQASDMQAASMAPSLPPNAGEAAPGFAVEKPLSAPTVVASGGIAAWAAAWKREETSAKKSAKVSAVKSKSGALQGEANWQTMGSGVGGGRGKSPAPVANGRGTVATGARGKALLQQQGQGGVVALLGGGLREAAAEAAKAAAGSPSFSVSCPPLPVCSHMHTPTPPP